MIDICHIKTTMAAFREDLYGILHRNRRAFVAQLKPMLDLYGF